MHLHMALRSWALCLLPFALLLAGCGPAPAAERPSPAAPPPTATSAPAAPPPTAAPTATSAPPPTASAAPAGAPSPSPDSQSAIGEEILFLRGGGLIAIGSRPDAGAPAFSAERLMARGVRDFAASPDGRRIALIRGEGAGGEIWLIERDGSGLRQITQNTRAESTPRWAPDGQTLLFTSGPEALPRPADWEQWSRWCAPAQVVALDLPAGQEQVIGPGCDPAVSPDGRRVAFVTPPQAQPDWLSFPGITNTLRLVNRQGANGWDPATAGTSPEDGLLVYGPAWSPDGAQVAYQRFLGYQALVDINLTEIVGAFDGDERPIGTGAGWLMPPAFAPDGRTVAVLDYNFSDARGFTGYDVWNLTLLRLGQPGSIVLPSAEYPTDASPIANLQQVTAFAWSPRGDQLVVLLPNVGAPFTDQPLQQPVAPAVGPGALWIWQPGAPPAAQIAPDVDFGSPLAWLPSP